MHAFFDLDQMTLIHEFKMYFWEIYMHIKNKIFILRISNVVL